MDFYMDDLGVPLFQETSIWDDIHMILADVRGHTL